MEVGFWRFLTEPDADGLPLKQRIPEVALFRGCSLLAGFYSNQRGLLQKRASCSKQFLLDRLLALSTKTADARDLCAQTPVAILRHHAGAPCVPKAQVLSASQLMELLERTERGQVPRAANGLPHLGEEEWSLQSLVLPPSNLRIVSVYSREPNGDESWDVVGQAFTQAYPLSNAPWQGGASPSSKVPVPAALASQVEAKSRHLVAYVQRFHGRSLLSLVSEFVPDAAGKAVLHGFWKVELSDKPGGAAFSWDSEMPSTALPSEMHSSRPTSATFSAVQSRPARGDLRPPLARPDASHSSGAGGRMGVDGQLFLAAGAISCCAVKAQRALRKRSLPLRKAEETKGDDVNSKLRVTVRNNVKMTVCRVGLWSIFTGLGAYLLYPSLQQCLWVALTGTKQVVPLGDVASGYVGNILALMSVLFSILAGNSYTSLYSQNEAIFCALFAEVSEAKALMEQIALVCSGRPFYRSALENIRRYVERDLRRLDRPPSILCAIKPRDDPLESILYLTSVGVPSAVYETVRSLRQRRGDRLGAVQRKLPPVQMALLYVLGGFNLLSLLLLALQTPSLVENRLCRSLFAAMAGALMMTMRVIHELWTPVGGAYNVDGVLRVMIRGLEDELDQRLKGKTFSDTRLPPPPPSFQKPAMPAAATPAES
ncbi:unnamed protein product [Effrenium voratum]|uniref:Uncharacterized protein n=1 Tax=Effrenium voratum TaxID=2562239 RepID=A0AA36JEH1_9DINO|nr:unnamed protein product [Effrenium voratum]